MPNIAHKIRINAPQEKVFQALSTAQGIKGWFAPEVDGTVAAGQTASFTFSNGETFRWRFADIAPAAIRWSLLEGPHIAPKTEVIFRLTSKHDGVTEVEVDHSGFPEGHAAIRSCNTLWGLSLWHLKQFTESSKTPHAEAYTAA